MKKKVEVDRALGHTSGAGCSARPQLALCLECRTWRKAPTLVMPCARGWCEAPPCVSHEVSKILALSAIFVLDFIIFHHFYIFFCILIHKITRF